MTIKDDRQSILNNGPELRRQFILDELDQLKVPVTANGVDAWRERNEAEHDDRKVHGYIGTRNRAIDVWRKTAEGKADRNPKARMAYADEAARQGRVSRTNTTGLTAEERTQRKKEQDLSAQRLRRKNLTETEREAIKVKDRERKRLAAAAKKIGQSAKSD